MRVMDSSEAWQHSIDDVQNALVYMYKHRLHTDVIFYIKSKGMSMCCSCFSAHKLVLATVSPVLADLFRNQGNKPAIIKNEDISTRGLDIFLWYVYSGILDIKSPNELAEASKAARYYNVKSLLSACKRHLLSCSVNAENVFSLLETMNHLDIDNKRKECLDLIEAEATIVIHTPGFLKADSETARNILQKSVHSFELKELMQLIIKWMKFNKLKDKSLLRCLDFSSMSCNDFITMVEKFPDFFHQDEIMRILANFAEPGIMEYPSWFTISSSNSNVANWPSSYFDACNLIKASSYEVKTACCRSLWKSSLFERDGFEASVGVKIELYHCFPGASCLVMLELAFGFAFVPDDCLDLNIYCLGLDLIQRKQKVKYCLVSTPLHFYVILDHKLNLQMKRSLLFMVEIKARGLRQWGKDGPVSNEQYRVAMIPKRINYDVYENNSPHMAVSLIPLTDWIAFIDSKNKNKNFVITSLFFNTDLNHEKFLKTNQLIN